MADVFISYSSANDQLALSLCHILENNGITCWIAPRDLNTKPTQRYADDIVDGIKDAKVLLLLLTKASNRSEHCMDEVSTACDTRKKVFVLQVEEIDTLNKTFTYYLSQEQRHIDLELPKTGDFEAVVKELGSFLNLSIEGLKEDYIEKHYQRMTNLRKLAERTLNKRQAYVMSIYDKNESEMDSSHIYEQITRLDVVDSELNTWSSYRLLTVRNTSDKPTTYLVHKECGESKASFKEMRIRAKLDGASGEKLKVVSATEIQPNLVQVFKIVFPAPLDPGESLTVFYRLDWPNEPSAYYMKELSQSISLSRYKKGVNKLTFAVFEPYRILSSSLCKVDDMNIEKVSELKPLMIDIGDEPLLEPLLEKLGDKQHYGVKYVIEDPQSKLYQIRYTKEEPDDDDDDDDFF